MQAIIDQWLLEKIFIIIAALIMLKLTGIAVERAVIRSYLYIKADMMQGSGGKMPSWKDAAGMFLFGIAQRAGPAMGDALVQKIQGGPPPGQNRQS